MNNFTYDQIYGMDLKSYCQLQHIEPSDLIQKIDTDIKILKKNLKCQVEKNNTDPLVKTIYDLIKKKEKHKERLQNWLS